MKKRNPKRHLIPQKLSRTKTRAVIRQLRKHREKPIGRAKTAPVEVYPVSQFKRPPEPARAGFEWLKAQRTAPATYKKSLGKFRVKVGRRYKYVEKFQTVKTRVRIKEWIQEPLRPIVPKKSYTWYDVGQYRKKSEDKLKKAYKLPIDRKAEIYITTRYVESTTKFGSDEMSLDTEKLYSVAIIYYFVKITGYKHNEDKIVLNKSSFGFLPRPMNIFELSNFVRDYMVPNIAGNVNKKEYLEFVDYLYFGAITHSEQQKEKISHKLERMQRAQDERVDIEKLEREGFFKEPKKKHKK